VLLGPDGGHPRRSNYARRVFRPACDGRYQPQPSKPPRLTIVDASAWPGIPVTTWAPAPPGDAAFTRPRGRGIRPIPEDTPVACWLPVKFGLNPHGMRHGHKTWMAEDGIPEILAEHRLGHEVPGMRGLYAHTSERMRDDLRAALQAPLGGLAPRTGRPPRALTRPAARRTPGALSRPSTGRNDTTRHPARQTHTRRQGEDDLPNSSQNSGRSHPRN
jgi:hypothetical protein